jgi:hypothetical protein
MAKNNKRSRYLTAAFPAVLTGLAIAACGSSSDPGRPSQSQLRADGIKYADCMRSHGVPNFPDPGSGAHGGISITINSASGINPFSPAFKAANSECKKFLPFGGKIGNGKPSPAAERRFLAISMCMRAHGIADFPDPTTKPPSNVSPGNYSGVVGQDGVFLELPSSIDPNSPAFKAAATTCHFAGPPGGQ